MAKTLLALLLGASVFLDFGAAFRIKKKDNVKRRTQFATRARNNHSASELDIIRSADAENANSPTRMLSVFIIRHGDKMSAYDRRAGSREMNSTEPVRKWSEDPPRHDKRYGNNPPLSPCGAAQATNVAEMLKSASIKRVLTSPLFRSWQTALPMFRQSRSSNIFVENHLVEDRQLHSTDILNDYWVNAGNLELASLLMSTGYFGFNSNYDVYATGPEIDEFYWQRVEVASKFFLQRLFKMNSQFMTSVHRDGNIAMFSHATTCISLVYALCANLWDNDPKRWYAEWASKNNIGPAGYVQVDLEVSRSGVMCKNVGSVDNSVMDQTACDPKPTTPKYGAKEGLCNYWRTDPDDFPLKNASNPILGRKPHCKFASHH